MFPAVLNRICLPNCSRRPSGLLTKPIQALTLGIWLAGGAEIPAAETTTATYESSSRMALETLLWRRACADDSSPHLTGAGGRIRESVPADSPVTINELHDAHAGMHYNDNGAQAASTADDLQSSVYHDEVAMLINAETDHSLSGRNTTDGTESAVMTDWQEAATRASRHVSESYTTDGPSAVTIVVAVVGAIVVVGAYLKS